MTDRTLERAQRATFHFDDDRQALRLIKNRLAATARQQPDDVIPYSTLVRGIVFHLPTVQDGAPIELGVPEWSGLHQSIIGGCLGRLSCDTFVEGRFLISAVAVSKATLEPSDGFNSLLEMLGLVASKRDPRCTNLWIEHLRKTYEWCRAHPQWPDA
ncbi:MAG: hypothetical protein AB7I50_15960 [Vicinamibacterales bacterium]